MAGEGSGQSNTLFKLETKTHKVTGSVSVPLKRSELGAVRKNGGPAFRETFRRGSKPGDLELLGLTCSGEQAPSK